MAWLGDTGFVWEDYIYNIDMAAFTAKDPTDQEAFTAHWQRILADTTVIIKTIISIIKNALKGPAS